MPAFSSTRPPAGPAISSPVVTDSLGATLLGALGIGAAVLALATGAALLGRATGAGLLALLLGAGLLALVWRLALRGSHQLVLTLTRASLHLAPAGRSAAQGIPPETIPLASIVAYKHWLRLDRLRVFAQYYLRLKLADGRVLRLADRPGLLPDDYPPGSVRLNEVATQLARWLPPGAVAQPLFFQTPLARALWWASLAALAAGPLLLWRGYLATGSLLLSAAISYGAGYYLGRNPVASAVLPPPGRSGRP